MVLGIGIGDWGLGLEIGIGDWELVLGIWIEDWDWKFGIRDGLRLVLGIEIGD